MNTLFKYLRTGLKFLGLGIVSILLAAVQFCVLVFMALFLLPFWKWGESPKIKRYVTRLFISIDQFFNTLLFGDEDETISARLARRCPGNRLCVFLCALLNLIDPDHCQKALESEKK